MDQKSRKNGLKYDLAWFDICRNLGALKYVLALRVGIKLLEVTIIACLTLE